MEELSVMVCVRVADLDDPVDGSTTTACVDCGVDVWISLESRKKLSEIGAMPMCEHCAKRLAEEVSSVGGISDGQMNEISMHLQSRGMLPHPFREDDLDLFEALKETAVKAGDTMVNPDDGWGSLCIFQDYQGTTFPPVPLSRMLAEGMPKDLLFKQLLPAMMQAAGAKRVVFGLAPKANGQLAGPGEADLVKALVLIDVTADGVQQVAMADTIRDGVSKPRLGDWRDIPIDEVGAPGQITESVVATLQFVRTLRES